MCGVINGKRTSQNCVKTRRTCHSTLTLTHIPTSDLYLSSSILYHSEACGSCGRNTVCSGVMPEDVSLPGGGPSASLGRDARADEATVRMEKETMSKYLNLAASGSVDDFASLIREVVARSPDTLKTPADMIRRYKDGNQRGALHFACLSGNMGVVQMILRDCPVDILTHRDKEGFTPFALSIMFNQLPIAEYLLGHGRTSSTTTTHDGRLENHYSTIHEVTGVASVGESENHMERIIHSVCTKGLHSVLEWVISQGGDINQDSRLGTPLCCAASHDSPDHVACLEILLHAGAQVNQLSQEILTPLLCAVTCGSLPSIKRLVEAGSDVMVSLPGNVTPLHIACESGSLDAIRYFLTLDTCNQVVNAQTTDIGEKHHKIGLKPIHYAGRKHVDIVELLLPLTSGLEGASSSALIKEQEASGDWDPPLDKRIAVDVMKLPRASIEAVEESKREKMEGNALFLKKDYQRCLHHYNRAIELHPHESVYWLNRSATNMALGHHDEALRDARTGRVLDSTSLKACYRVGVALEALELYEDAALTFFDGVNLAGDDEGRESMRSHVMRVVEKGRKKEMKV